MAGGLKGFTRKQLVVGVVVFAALVWGIAKSVVVPKVKDRVLGLTRSANEASAEVSMREIGLAELQYNVAHPEVGFTCSLEALGGSAVLPGVEEASVLPTEVALGHKNGYQFAITECARMAVDGRQIITGYKATAVPENAGKTGQRSFCIDETSVIKIGAVGGVSCLQ